MEIPEACTLPSADRPPRLAEFDTLFAESVRAVEHRTPTHARLHLAGPASAVRDLAARESECCSFFTFTVSQAEDEVILDIEVPARYSDVLASLVERAR
jgi:hypothetical protein